MYILYIYIYISKHSFRLMFWVWHCTHLPTFGQVNQGEWWLSSRFGAPYRAKSHGSKMGIQPPQFERWWITGVTTPCSSCQKKCSMSHLVSELRHNKKIGKDWPENDCLTFISCPYFCKSWSVDAPRAQLFPLALLQWQHPSSPWTQRWAASNIWSRMCSIAMQLFHQWIVAGSLFQSS